MKTLRLHRLGALNAVKYDRTFNGTPSSTPERKGVYAFPEGCGDAGFTQWKVSNRARGRKHIRFQFRGLIWCHLEHWMNPRDVIERRGSWVLVTTDTLIRLMPVLLALGRDDGALCEVFIGRGELRRARQL